MSLLKETIAKWAPPPKLNLHEWSERYAHLSAESSAIPGKWHSLPYQVGIEEAVTNPHIETITLMKSARVGYTKILNNTVGYHIHQDPCNIMVVQPTIEDAQGHSKDEIAPMVRDTPVLRGLISDPKTRRSSNTILKKMYPGGTMYLAGANSPRAFRRVSVRVLLFDEVDGYPPSAGTEGDQISLGKRRTEYFWNRKIIIGSTPTIAGVSKVEDSFAKSDQRYFMVPCPHCGEFQRLKWENLDWPEGNPERAYFICQINGCQIEHKDKREMVTAGYWEATKETKNHAGFHIWAAYSFSPNATWGQLATEYLDAKQDTEKLQTFTNTVRGIPFEQEYEELEWELLYNRRQEYKIPKEIMVLTAFVDVQGDRLEVGVDGWREGEESWSVDYRVLWGDTTQKPVWVELDKLLTATYTRDDGVTLDISICGVDSGYRADHVYDYVRPRQFRRIFATKGKAGMGRPIVTAPVKTKVDAGRVPITLFTIGADTAKGILFDRLVIPERGPGYCHFNMERDEEYFKQLCAERGKIKYIRGHRQVEYVKTRARNEALDIKVGNMAMLRILNPNFKLLADNFAKMDVNSSKNEKKDDNSNPFKPTGKFDRRK